MLGTLSIIIFLMFYLPIKLIDVCSKALFWIMKALILFTVWLTFNLFKLLFAGITAKKGR